MTQVNADKTKNKIIIKIENSYKIAISMHNLCMTEKAVKSHTVLFPSLQYVLNKFIGILHLVNNIKSWVLADALQHFSRPQNKNFINSIKLFFYSYPPLDIINFNKHLLSQIIQHNNFQQSVLTQTLNGQCLTQTAINNMQHLHIYMQLRSKQR